MSKEPQSTKCLNCDGKGTPDWIKIQGKIMRQLAELVQQLMEENKQLRKKKK